MVGIGGAVTNLVAVQLGLDPYDPEAVRGARVDAAEVERQIERYRSQDADARRATKGLQTGRADVILAGACIVRAVMEGLRQSSLVSATGVCGMGPSSSASGRSHRPGRPAPQPGGTRA